MSGGTYQNNSQTTTGYFKGGVPQELYAQALSNQTNPSEANQIIGSSSNELTMKGVAASSDLDHNNDAIESFKQRNIKKNIKAVFKRPGEEAEHVEESSRADASLIQKSQVIHSQEEEQIHAIEDFENMGHVLNL